MDEVCASVSFDCFRNRSDLIIKFEVFAAERLASAAVNPVNPVPISHHPHKTGRKRFKKAKRATLALRSSGVSTSSLKEHSKNSNEIAKVRAPNSVVLSSFQSHRPPLIGIPIGVDFAFTSRTTQRCKSSSTPRAVDAK